ncbi:hypothetical protein EDB89DRAFT_1914122 [Lactarius sanguifluus]|nr:hypothetical protein EDB89DRAFT_1914122 [Lactarius sanguifluus]
MAGRRWRGFGVVVIRCVVGCCVPCWGGTGVGGGWGLACHVEGAWRVGGVLACVGSGWRWAWCAALRWRGGSVGSWRAVLGRRGGLAVAGWRGRMEVARVHEWAAISRVLHHVGAARWVGGGGVSEQDGGGLRA